MLWGTVKWAVVEGSASGAGSEPSECEVEGTEGIEVRGEEAGEGEREDQMGEEVVEWGGDCEGGGEFIAESVNRDTGWLFGVRSCVACGLLLE